MALVVQGNSEMELFHVLVKDNGINWLLFAAGSHSTANSRNTSCHLHGGSCHGWGEAGVLCDGAEMDLHDCGPEHGQAGLPSALWPVHLCQWDQVQLSHRGYCSSQGVCWDRGLALARDVGLCSADCRLWLGNPKNRAVLWGAECKTPAVQPWVFRKEKMLKGKWEGPAEKGFCFLCVINCSSLWAVCSVTAFTGEWGLMLL